MATCYYKILGISAKASQEEIKRAFRLLAFRCHPDRNPGNPHAGRNFREALEAYETLSDPLRRNRYDKLRGYARNGNGNRKRNNATSRGNGTSLEDAIREAFGVEVNSARERRVNDLRFDLQVPHSVLKKGTYEWIDYGRRVFCDECMGNGRKVPLHSCKKCKGEGELEEVCSLRVWIPAGSVQGNRFRISGAGDQPLPWSRAGDLVILLHVADQT